MEFAVTEKMPDTPRDIRGIPVRTFEECIRDYHGTLLVLVTVSPKYQKEICDIVAKAGLEYKTLSEGSVVQWNAAE